MEEFPSNSRQTRPTPKAKPAEEKKQIKQVATATQRKKSVGRRIKETFFSGTTKGVWEYMMVDVLVPAAKDMVADAVSQGVERMVFGEARSVGRRTGARPVNNYAPQTSYNRYSSPVGRAAGHEQARSVPGRRVTEAFDFDEIVLATRVEADTVIERLMDLSDRYGSASVADLYELVGVTAQYTDDKYGWEDLRDASHTRTRDGYVLNLPKPIPLEK